MRKRIAHFNRWKLGHFGERWAKTYLETVGLKVTQPEEHKQGDLITINTGTGLILKIEVKTARQAVDGKWRFTLRKDGHTDHRNADILILLALDRDLIVYPFVVPVEALRAQHQTVITSHPEKYSGKLAPFRNAWNHIIDSTPAREAVQ